MRFVLILILTIIFYIPCNGQGGGIPIGAWRVHKPYYIITSAAFTGDKIYAASPYGSFYLDLEDNSMNVISKVSGLSGTGITQMAYNKFAKCLVIGYEDGNIDLVKNGEIVNITDIRRATSVIGSKRINHINFVNEFAYLSTDFGLVVLNLKREEVRESLLDLREGGGPARVFNSVISDDKDSIFLATEYGVMTAKYNANLNLMDFGNWHRYNIGDGIPVNNLVSIAYFKGKLFAAFNNGKVYQKDGEVWAEKNLLAQQVEIRNMSVSNNKLIICAEDYVLVLNSKENISDTTIVDKVNYPISAIYDDNDRLWIADFSGGLRMYDGANYFSYIPNGTSSIHSFKLYAYEDNVITLSGGYNNSFVNLYRADGYSIFAKDNIWRNFYPEGSRDFVNATYNPNDKKLYLSSYFNGLYEIDNAFNIVKYQDEIFSGPGYGLLRITDSKLDSRGQLWVTNHSVPSGSHSLFVRGTDRTWKGYSFTQNAARFPLELVVDDNDNKWMRLGSSGGVRGLVVFQENGNRARYFNTAPAYGQPGLPDRFVNCITKDKNGEIWVGTNNGVAVFYNTFQAFNNNNDFLTPIVDGFPLLMGEMVTCIKVDGGNRKWIGTANGVWLLDPSGTEVVFNFTTSNSPLLSNYIVDIAINEKTGEVFMGTDKGIISFRGTATEGETSHGNIKVFPNPVKHGFDGKVGITGLAANAYVKITDVQGHLIYETRAQGGMAVWDLRNYNGQYARSGVYLVFSTSQDGTESVVSKIAVIE